MTKSNLTQKLAARYERWHLEDAMAESPQIGNQLISMQSRIVALEARPVASAPPPPPPAPKPSPFAAVDEARRGMEALAPAFYQKQKLSSKPAPASA